jgi:hypothetical protein
MSLLHLVLFSPSLTPSLALTSTTVDIQPLSLNLHEYDLRELVEFFHREKQPTPIATNTTTTTTTITTNTTSATKITETNKTKVIVENLELILGTGSQETENTVVLRARQLFFAAQPFKAGVTECKLECHVA